MIDRHHELSISKPAKALKISRGSVYYLPRPVSAANLAVMRRMDELHLELPFAGSRMLRDLLHAEGLVSAFFLVQFRHGAVKAAFWNHSGGSATNRWREFRALYLA